MFYVRIYSNRNKDFVTKRERKKKKKVISWRKREREHKQHTKWMKLYTSKLHHCVLNYIGTYLLWFARNVVAIQKVVHVFVCFNHSPYYSSQFAICARRVFACCRRRRRRNGVGEKSEWTIASTTHHLQLLVAVWGLVHAPFISRNFSMHFD